MLLNDAEPACARMVEKVYADRSVQAALADFVLLVSSPDTHAHETLDRRGEMIESCANYPGVRCSEHQAVEREMRARFADGSGAVIVPQHVVLRADGDVLVKRPYAMKKPGFLEFLSSARGLVSGGATGATGAPGSAPARSVAVEKLAKALHDAKDSSEREKAARALASDASPERQQAFLEELARMRNSEERGEAVRALGRFEHQLWAPTIAALLDEKDRHLRNCAVVTLEEQKAGAVIEDLLDLWGTEKDPELRKDLLRALGPCGSGNEAAKRLLFEELQSAKEAHRCAAALSLGSLLMGAPDVASAIEARAKKEKSEAVRMAMVWGIGESADPAQASLLEKLIAREKDSDMHKVASVARARLDGKPIEAAGKALGKGGGKEVRRLLGLVFDDDKITRNFIRDADRRISGKQ
ncbi:MAG: HEAT repeat domain-containing protein [Planctomycetes bacterium]|nr:HEAT repeat domain-containing protein [Planctomycetota bacterium]